MAKSKVAMKVNGDSLDITAKLGAGEISSTGKSMIIASTGGFVVVPGTDYKVNVVVIKKV